MIGPADVVADYRDDGPVAILLGRTGGDRVRVDPVLLTVAGLLPLVAIVVGSDRAPGTIPPGLGLAIGWLVLCAGVAAGRPASTRLGWLVPPLLRLAEYAVLLVLVLLTDGQQLPVCFALLSVLSFHHYDTVYRIRARRAAPPMWVRLAGGGWDVRVLAAYVLLVIGGLAVGMGAAAVLLGVLYVGESVASWLAPGPALAASAELGIDDGAEEGADE